MHLENGDYVRWMLDEQGLVCQLFRSIYHQDAYQIQEDVFPQFYQEVLQPNLDYLKIQTDMNLDFVGQTITDIRLFSDMEHGSIRVWGNYLVDGKKRRLFISDAPGQPITMIEAIVKRYSQTQEDDMIVFPTKNQNLFRFLDEGIPKIQSVADVYISQDLQKLKYRTTANFEIGFSLQNQLLDIDLKAINVTKEELFQILQSYRRKKQFHKLKNGEIIELDNPELEKLDTISQEFGLTKDDFALDGIQRPAYTALHVDHDEVMEAYAKQLEDLKVEKPFQLPDFYKNLLRPYQVEGVRWMHALQNMQVNGILADDMGLGKTLQVLCLLDCFTSHDKPSLIVCPSSLMFNWDSEIRKFELPIDAICVNGTSAQRKKLIAQNHQLYITTYDYMRRDVNEYAHFDFDYVVLDEAQYIKNPKTKNAQSVKLLKTDHKLALTGTPIENSLTELWSLFDFLLPGFLYDLQVFGKIFEKPILLDKDEPKQEQLQKLVSPFILRRTKKQVLQELPDKEERDYWLNFTEAENKLYLANLAQVNQQMQEQLKMEKVDSIVVLSMMTRLRQLCCEPRMVFNNIEHPSTKLLTCVQLVETLKENNKKVLLFSSFTRIFDYLIEEFEKRGIRYHILTGQTPKEKRKEEVEAFQNDDSDVFLISLKAGGTGLNLTAAQAVIHYDPWWNVSAQNQATDRAYRIGQTKNVLVYQLLMQNSIEEKIYKMQLRKKEISDIFIEQKGTSISSLSKEDLMDIFSMQTE